MHELSLAQSLVRIVHEEAERHGLGRVSRFTVRVGELRAVVPDLLQTCVGVASVGTRIEGAELVLEVVEGRARCASCATEFSIHELLFICPRCERVGGEVLAGQELALVELEGE